jgi:HD-GYP domain-containing protein (c-di-GMP phosphodiesterase class II)
MSIVDVFDALTTARPYKPAVDIDRALRELRREADLGWRRRDLVDRFLEIPLEPCVLHSREDVLRQWPRISERADSDDRTQNNPAC